MKGLNIVLAVVIIVSSQSCRSDTNKIDKVLALIHAGKIADGVHVGDAPYPNRPSTDFYRTDKNGADYGLLVFREASTRTVSLYWKDQKFYGACLKSRGAKEVWFFCDTDKLSSHVRLAILSEKTGVFDHSP